MSKDFEFIVRRGWADRSKWQVCLPHQCDEWEIAGGGFNEVPHSEAVVILESFIDQAQKALAALKAKKELNED